MRVGMIVMAKRVVGDVAVNGLITPIQAPDVSRGILLTATTAFEQAQRAEQHREAAAEGSGIDLWNRDAV